MITNLSHYDAIESVHRKIEMGNVLTNELQIIKQLINKVDDYKMGLQCAHSLCFVITVCRITIITVWNLSLFVARYCCALFIFPIQFILIANRISESCILLFFYQ